MIINNIRYLGRKYGQEKEKMFEDADIFVFPTYYENETFGLVILEAMAHHLPIVTTNEGGIVDIVIDGENGFISRQRDAVSLADCLECLMKDENIRKKMGTAGRKRLELLFTEERFEERMKEVLLEVIE